MSTKISQEKDTAHELISYICNCSTEIMWDRSPVVEITASSVTSAPAPSDIPTSRLVLSHNHYVVFKHALVTTVQIY